jgi:YaiO family outer membrane protein
VRLGTEFYQNFNNYSTSIGARYLHFNQSQVTMFTGHLGRSFHSFNISYRPYLLSLSDNWFSSHILNFRKSFEEKEAFVQLDLQYGAVPYYFFVSQEFLRTSAFRVGVNCRFRVSDNIFIQPIFMFELEEYIPKEFRNRYNTQLILSKRF